MRILTGMDKEDIERRLLKRRNITPTGCWEYNGARNKEGYGQLTVSNRMYGVHRLAAWVWKGFSHQVNPAEIAHVCDNTSCFNPEHLFIATHTENCIDSIVKGRRRRLKRRKKCAQ